MATSTVSLERLQLAISLLDEIGTLADAADRACFHFSDYGDAEAMELLIDSLREKLCRVGWMSDLARHRAGEIDGNLCRGASAEAWLISPRSRKLVEEAAA